MDEKTYLALSYGPGGERVEGEYGTLAEATAHVERLRTAGTYADTETRPHPEGCSCGSPNCPQWQADHLGGLHCDCGWEGDWTEVYVELPSPDGSAPVIGPDPERRHTDPPYFCPECGEEI